MGAGFRFCEEKTYGWLNSYTLVPPFPIIPPLWRIMLNRESGENPELARSGKGERSDIRALPKGGKPSPRHLAPESEDLPKFVFLAERNRPRNRYLRELKDL